MGIDERNYNTTDEINVELTSKLVELTPRELLDHVERVRKESQRAY